MATFNETLKEVKKTFPKLSHLEAMKKASVVYQQRKEGKEVSLKPKAKKKIKEEIETYNKRRDKELLKGSLQDKLVLVARKAYKLAEMNKFEGLKDLVKNRQHHYTAFHSIGKKNGKIYRLDSESPKLKLLVEKAKKSSSDIVNEEYTTKVRDFLREFLTIGKMDTTTAIRNLDIIEEIEW